MDTINKKTDSRKPKNIKHHNVRYVLSILKKHGVSTASEISKESNLSVTTIVKILDILKREGLAKSCGKGPSTREGGKRPELLAFNETYKYVTGVFFLRTKARYVLTDLSGNTLLLREAGYRDGTDMDACIEDACRQVSEILAEQKLNAAKDLCGISILIDGVVNARLGTVVYPIHNRAWKPGRQIIDRFKTYFPETEHIMIENSGRLWSQRFLESHPELAMERILTIYTGVKNTSGVLLDNGEIVHGANCLIGEFGHMMVPNVKRAVMCECGRTNCFEKLIAIDRLPEYTLEEIDKSAEPELYERLTEHTISPAELMGRADEGSRAVQRVMDQITEYYLAVISNLMITCDPKYYVIGGAYASGSRYFRDGLVKRFDETTFWGIPFGANILFDTSAMEDGNRAYMTAPVIRQYLQTLRLDD